MYLSPINEIYITIIRRRKENRTIEDHSLRLILKYDKKHYYLQRPDLWDIMFSFLEGRILTLYKVGLKETIIYKWCVQLK